MSKARIPLEERMLRVAYALNYHDRVVVFGNDPALTRAHLRKNPPGKNQSMLDSMDRKLVLSVLRLVEQEAEERGEKKGWEKACGECDKIISDRAAWTLVAEFRALAKQGPPQEEEEV